MTTHQAELSKLIETLGEAASALEGLAPHKRDLDQIIEMIKVKKGWTTPAELEFAQSIAAHLVKQVRSVGELATHFESASRRVGG